jgi:cytochrome P450
VKTEITRRVLRRLTGDGLLSVDGNEHRRQRKILNPAFASPHIKNLIGAFWRKSCELKDLWEQEGVNCEGKQGYEVFNALTRTTLDIIGLAGFLHEIYTDEGFGYDFGALKDATNPVAKAYFTIFDNSPETLIAPLLVALYPGLERLPFSWIKRSNDAKDVIINAASTLILSKSVEEERYDEKDILGCMLQENKRLEEIGEEGLSKDEIIYQILTFLAAGYLICKHANKSHETTSTAIVWALYELSEHPDVQDRLREEIHSVLGKNFHPEIPPTSEQLDQMKYLNNVCREVLRIDPPGTFLLDSSNSVPITARQATADDVFGGVLIPKDTVLLFSTLVINMQPSIWGPDSSEFRPERWEDLKEVPNTHFLTFQHGNFPVVIADG